jgi:hypothetical protein
MAPEVTGAEASRILIPQGGHRERCTQADNLVAERVENRQIVIFKR